MRDNAVICYETSHTKTPECVASWQRHRGAPLLAAACTRWGRGAVIMRSLWRFMWIIARLDLYQCPRFYVALVDNATGGVLRAVLNGRWNVLRNYSLLWGSVHTHGTCKVHVSRARTYERVN